MRSNGTRSLNAKSYASANNTFDPFPEKGGMSMNGQGGEAKMERKQKKRIR
jgi:hypothetical protein